MFKSKTSQKLRNCPDITILNYRFIHGHIHGLGLHLGISHGIGHGLGYVLVMPYRVSHFQSSFRTNVSKVKICAQILKWRRFLTVIYWFLTAIHRFLTVIHRFLTVILTRGRCRAARAAKNILYLSQQRYWEDGLSRCHTVKWGRQILFGI